MLNDNALAKDFSLDQRAEFEGPKKPIEVKQSALNAAIWDLPDTF